MEANETAHSPAFNHLITMIKSGLIGDVVDVSASGSQSYGREKGLHENGILNKLVNRCLS